MDKNDVQQALLDAAGRAAALADSAIEGAGTDAGTADQGAVERYANAAKALAEAAEVAGRA